MKPRIAFFVAAAYWLGITTWGTAQQTTPGVPDRIVASIDAQHTAEPVSKYEFGMFIEHLRSLIYRSLWAEMIDDRKFYFPITSEPEAQPPAQAGGAFRNMQLRKWRPVGPDENVVMDKDKAFVGDQSPQIHLDASAPHGIRQSGLALIKGKQYTGRIYIRGTAGTKVNVSLIWGAGENDRQSLTFASVTNDYKKYPLGFTARADSEDAALEITGTGRGDFHIGTVSLMPTDNVGGFRPDTTALLRQLRSGFWRLPGGNFISDWNWYDSVGDIDKRPPMFDHAWNAMQTNDVGMDELMTLCKLIGVEPYITVNAGFGDAHSAADEVEYMNGSVNTRLGALRAHNGHPEPYHVKYWDIGNEPYGTWQLGRTTLHYFALKTNDFAREMRKADPSITLLASGAMPDEMTVTGQTRALHLPIQAQFGTDGDFTGGLLAQSWGSFDGLTEHWYARSGKRFDLKYAESLPASAPQEAGYVNVDQTLLEWAHYPSNRVKLKADEWREYQKRFPAMVDKKIFLSVDEYAYSGVPPSLKLALAYAMVFNEMMRHTDLLTMSAFTMGVSTLDYNRTAATFNTNGLLFKMYGDHFTGSIPVALSGNSPQPAPKYPIAGDQPGTNPGSPTYPLDMFAALTPDRKFLTLAVVNATESEQKFDLNVTGIHVAGPATLWQMTANSLDAANHVGAPPQVEIKETSLGEVSGTIPVAPISINIYRFPVQ